ncbi:MAG: hypothetical protein K1X88_34420, partial [Nannocystaceae bacterium]|nr:hypothetical protein [Nannocystaceae bacterium]
MSGDAIAGVLASRRLGRGAAPRQAFTVESTEARLRLRQRPGAEPWSWTLVLVRALLALTDVVDVTGETVAREDVHELALGFAFDPEVVQGLELGLLFDAAIEPDPGPGDGSLARRQLRFRRLLARALNEALASAPRSLTLECSLGSRSFVRRDGAGDPYTERMGPPRGRPGSWVVTIAVERTVSRWFDALVSGKEGLFAGVRALWAARVPGAQVRAGAATLQVPPLEGTVPLGRVARLLPAATQWRGWLVRDGVLVCSIAAALREQGLPAEATAVAIECPALQLTVDENAVVKDDALALLTAWLHDASAHATGGALLSATWPAEPEAMVDAAGTVVAREGLLALAQQGRELTYVWRHEAQTLPLALRDRVLAPWPSQLEALARDAPQLRMVPVRVVAETADEGRLELEPLAQGSLPPWTWAPPPWPRPHGDAIAIAATAYVHRHGVAAQSTTVIAAHDRVLLREPAGRAAVDAGLTGVTLVLRLALSSTSQSLARARARGDGGDRAEAAAQLRELVAWGWSQLATQRDALLQHALAVPLDDALR